ncbi:hypothetical protein BCR44DRAFT_1429499 [Catenaria anguillulae PL171]|uniref:Uncharacterized protein n=1 Tax=Catenaria anguillulae PL171 TaxID=765915 RepID=A0A1Y2HTY0_9FUNG|nr:hypothetical protein BCR44DRAFT_1429499 [Catenaria anguillulae PL171]
MPLEFIKYIIFACCVCLLVMFAWLLRPRQVVINDGEAGERIITVAPALSLADYYVRSDEEARHARERAEAILREAMAHQHQVAVEDAIDPLPPYSLYGGNDDVHLDLESRLAIVVDQLESGGIVVSATRPVLASAGTPILPVSEGAGCGSCGNGGVRQHQHHRRSRHATPPGSRQNSAPSSPTNPLFADPISPSIVPSDPLPIVRLTLSLPPPPKYADKVGVRLEANGVDEGGCACASSSGSISSPSVPAAPPSSPVLSPVEPEQVPLPMSPTVEVCVEA